MSYKKKNLIYLLIIISLLRFLISYDLPSFYMGNLRYDDKLMIKQMNALVSGNYLGVYNDYTFIKGIVFPLLLSFLKLTKISYSVFFTVLYIAACIFFTKCLSSVIKNKGVLVIIYIIILFNPISYSLDLFQRLYRNSLSLTLLLFFLGIIIKIITQEKIRNYIFLGIILSIMFLTREDSMWATVIVIFVFCYKLYKTKKFKILPYFIIPFLIVFINRNVLSFINYKYYGIYTYNEIQKSNFNSTFLKILKIKDDEKIDKVSITKSTFYKLCENTKSFGITKEEIDEFYRRYSDDNNEINNGNIIWYFRRIVSTKYEFKNIKESEAYYERLGNEIDELFEKNILEEEIYIPSIYIKTPNISELKRFPVDLFEAINYTSNYTNVGTLTDMSKYKYEPNNGAYSIIYRDYHHTENIVEKNSILYEIIRVFYKIINIIFSPLCLLIYIVNIRKKDKLNLIIHIIFICYIMILFGVTYTNTTAFHAIRYFYLGNVYMLQSLFILLNLCRINFNDIRYRIIDGFKKA